MAVSRIYSDKINNSRFENIDLTTAELATQAEWDAAGGAGYYQKTNLEDMINNFMVMFVGEDKVLKRAPRHEVAVWGQRAVQEFSYDVLYSEKFMELEVDPNKLVVNLPTDYVNYVKLTWVDGAGRERIILPARRTSAAQAVIQDDRYNFIYDDDGDNITAEFSEALTRFQEPNLGSNLARLVRSYYYGSDVDGGGLYGYSRGFNGAFGRDPVDSFTDGTFVIDTYKGKIYFDSSFASGNGNQVVNGVANTIVTLRYISDGLQENEDLTKVYVHKFAEEAIYFYILANMTAIRPTAANLYPIYQKKAVAKMRNTKIRLSNYKIEEIQQHMRGKSTWTKH